MSSGSKTNSAAATPVGQQQVIQKSEPWAEQKPYLLSGFNSASFLYNNAPRTYYPNSTVTPFSNQTNDALRAAEERARAGSSLASGGREQMERTVRGDYLRPESNEFLAGTYNAMVRPMVEQYRNAIAPSNDAEFIRAGRYGSGLYANRAQQQEDTLQRGLGEAATRLYGDNLARERQIQAQAIGMAPDYAARDYDDIARLAGVGGTREAKAGEHLQEDIDRFNFNQNAARADLADYMAMIQGNYGRDTTTISPIYGAQSSGSTFGNVLSGLGGLGLLASGLGGLRLFRRGGMVRRPASHAWGT